MKGREVKLGAPEGFQLPDLGACATVLSLCPGKSSERSTVYFDTGDFRLARWGDSFRYRAGEGWTVKLSGDDYGALLVRDEVVFEGSPTTPPRGAVDLVPGYLRRAELGPKVRLRTVRRGVLLNDVQGRMIVDVVDDRVSVLDGQRVVAGFREREVETTGDTPSGLLKRCSYAYAPPAQCVGLWPVVRASAAGRCDRYQDWTVLVAIGNKGARSD
jgi:hypothetical protein